MNLSTNENNKPFQTFQTQYLCLKNGLGLEMLMSSTQRLSKRSGNTELRSKGNIWGKINLLAGWVVSVENDFRFQTFLVEICLLSQQIESKLIY